MTERRFFRTNGAKGSTLLLRRIGIRDEAYLRGAWVQTTLVWAYTLGEDSSIDEISEAQARQLVPEAFAA